MKLRLDKLLATREPEITRNKIQAYIAEGKVRVAKEVVTKPSFLVDEADEIELILDGNEFVSRAAHKLDYALDEYAIDVENKVCLDLGASTGGFTEVLLRRGAAKVYALDVGSMQLAPDLRENARVVVMENQNARYIDCSYFGNEIDFISCDLSFISLKLIIPAISKTLKPAGEAVVLIKPQFEVGSQNLSKKGLVKDERAALKAVDEIAAVFQTEGFEVVGCLPSPIKGSSGNQEYLMYVRLSFGIERKNKEEE